jgi:hypothetical protein
MINNIVYSMGVVAYYKASLEFSIIDEKLLLQSGIAYDEKGMPLQLTQQSYVILENIDLVFFENHTKYYFYLTSKRSFEGVTPSHFLVYVEIEKGIYFCMGTQQHDTFLLLGEVEIDYDQGNRDGVRTITIPNNAFVVGKNEIDLKNVSKHMILPSPVTILQQRRISHILFNFAEVLHRKMVEENRLDLSVLCSAFFQFSEKVKSEMYSPYALYQKFESHVALFSWIACFSVDVDVVLNLQKLEALFDTTAKVFKTSFYHLDIEENETLCYQVCHTLEALTTALGREVVIPQTKEVSEKNTLPVTEYLSEDFSNISTPSENITVVEESFVEDGEVSATVLLGGDREDYVQIGRGTQSGNDIILGEQDKTVSRIHIKITAHKQGFFLEDLSSMGTYVNGERIEKGIKKFVTKKHTVVLGKKNCLLDLSNVKIQALLNR